MGSCVVTSARSVTALNIRIYSKFISEKSKWGPIINSAHLLHVYPLEFYYLWMMPWVSSSVSSATLQQMPPVLNQCQRCTLWTWYLVKTYRNLSTALRWLGSSKGNLEQRGSAHPVLGETTVNGFGAQVMRENTELVSTPAQAMDVTLPHNQSQPHYLLCYCLQF